MTPIRTVAVFLGSSSLPPPPFHDLARAAGTALATSGIAVVYGGASVGLMGELADAALAAGGSVVLHNGFGLGLGYLAGKLGRLDDKARRALAFEVGMQNSGLAATLATAHFGALAALPSAVFSLWHNVSGAIVAAWLARRPVREASVPDASALEASAGS